jgi:hypothetical protein
VVRGQQYNFPVEHAAAEVGDRHLGGLNAAYPAIVGIHARQIFDGANHDIRSRGERWALAPNRKYSCQGDRPQRGFHGLSLK